MGEQQAERWHRVSSKTLMQCPMFSVKENQFARDGTEKSVPFYIVEVPDWVNVIALTDKSEVVLIEQYRQGIEEMIIEIPSGVIDKGEDPRSAAKRELLEETGYEATEWKLLATTQPNPALHNNRVHHFLATGARRVSEPELDENESLQTVVKGLEDTEQLIDNGTIAQSMVVAAFYYFNRLNRKNEDFTR
jgi:ADP-ribose pyrophosphatase